MECFRCHGPFGQLHLAGGTAQFTGTTVAENGDPGGVVTVPMGRPPSWAATRVSSDASVPAHAASASGRVTVAHTGGRCTVRRQVTSEARTAAYHAAVAAGRTRISLLDLKAQGH